MYYRRGSYLADRRTTSWMKIKEAAYSQLERRQELFDRSGVERLRTIPRTLSVTHVDTKRTSNIIEHSDGRGTTTLSQPQRRPSAVPSPALG
jgi:hypothetical protein